MGLQQLLDYLNDFLSSYVATVVGTLTAGLVAIAAAIGTIYVVNYGVSVMRGDVSEPMEVFAWKSMKMGFIAALALTSSLYLSFVYDGFDAMQHGMALMFVKGGYEDGKDAATAFSALDAFYIQADTHLTKLRMGANPFTAWDRVVADMIFNVGLCVFMLIAAAVTLMSKVFLAFGATLGPIAILCLVFESTNRFFHSWLGYMLSAVVMTWFAFFALGLGLSVLDKVVIGLEAKGVFVPGDAGPDAISPIRGAMTFLVLSLLMGLMVYQAPKLAAALTGGPSVSTGAMGVAGFALGRLTGGAKGSSSGSGGSSGGGGSVAKGSAYSAGKAAGSYAFERVASLMRRR
jgi:type IV secretion system protein VirB6